MKTLFTLPQYVNAMLTLSHRVIYAYIHTYISSLVEKQFLSHDIVVTVIVTGGTFLGMHPGISRDALLHLRRSDKSKLSR